MLRSLCITSILIAGFSVVLNADTSEIKETRNAKQIVTDALNHWRGLTSLGQMTMTIHRPDWERSMTIQTWTKGDKQSLIRVTAPRKDRGNATLMDDNNLWSFSPKVNRVIKIPSSMMSQSWMGSDFSNRDISRADEVIEEYDHTLLNTAEQDGHKVFKIELIPHEDSAIVWGREVMSIRDDNVLIDHSFYDQDNALVKTLLTLEIKEMGGRTVASHQRMEKIDAPGEWTELNVASVEFDIELSDNVFTLSNLRNPRE